MFSSRRTGGVMTSVRLHPIKLLILGLALMLVGVAAMVAGADMLWAIPVGLIAVILGVRLV
jgi:hypothetical protein